MLDQQSLEPLADGADPLAPICDRFPRTGPATVRPWLWVLLMHAGAATIAEVCAAMEPHVDDFDSDDLEDIVSDVFADFVARGFLRPGPGALFVATSQALPLVISLACLTNGQVSGHLLSEPTTPAGLRP